MNKTFLRPASPALVATVAAALLLGGCANMSERQKGTAVGAGIGAGVGAVIGKTTGGKAGTGAVVGGAIGAVAGNLWSKRMEDKRREMEQATAGTGVTVARTDDNQLRVNLPGDISFDTGRSNIRPDMAPILSKFAQGLDGSMNVQITGHTDSQGSDAINNPLSKDRADAVRDYLVAQGVPATRISTVGRGEHQPIADNATAEGRAKNRRVEIFLREPAKTGG
ncbi:outer membrane protein OmpA-like peptidoglycan-associated protein [Sphaerotilus sulfidivorans]|uniref:OmpA family protein n=1 Tax=Sphaerotilus sulfidivorans TaxID=639200 RepID=A0A5C1Q494_9BURK|nr:OmpA family protein [Sphaerotilus sulfidivorans]NZD45125.1 OmpA family protein [Sphaerotilus sulfidivorans]QEN02381.1 OmpA family protein [Sphaerotilus sulfidivorans]